MAPKQNFQPPQFMPPGSTRVGGVYTGAEKYPAECYCPPNGNGGGGYPPPEYYGGPPGYCPPGWVPRGSAMPGPVAAASIDEYARRVMDGYSEYFGPRYSYFNLLGATDVTGWLAPGEFTVFEVGLGGQGQGWGLAYAAGAQRGMRLSETNHETGKTLPAGVAIAAASVAVDYNPEIPLHAMQHLDRFLTVVQEKQNTLWKMGRAALWGESGYHIQSRSVGVTIANELIHFTRNGGTLARTFPPGSEMVFQALDQIQFTFRLEEGLFMTSDGNALNGLGTYGQDTGGNGLPANKGAGLGIVMECVLFQQQAA